MAIATRIVWYCTMTACTPALRDAAREVLASASPALSAAQRATLQPVIDGSADGLSVQALRVLRGRLGHAVLFELLGSGSGKSTGTGSHCPQWRAQRQARAQERAYQRMVGDLSSTGDGITVSGELSSAAKQASIGANMLAAIVTAGFIGHYAGGMLSHDDDKGANRWIGALVGVVVMVMVEMVLFIARESMQDHRDMLRLDQRRRVRGAGDGATAASDASSAAPESKKER